MPCTVKKTFQLAAETGNDLLVQVKGNQRWLLDRIKRLTQTARCVGRHDQRDRARARQEDRTVEIFAIGDALAGSAWQPWLRTAIRVTRHCLKRNAKTGLWRRCDEVAYYVTSASGLPAKVLAHAIRQHWGIENCNHYVRDVTFAEDYSRIRKNPGIMARTRSLALNLLRASGTRNIALALWENALSFENLMRYQTVK